MAVSSDSIDAPRRHPLARLADAIKAALAERSDRSRALRSAGAAFLIRVASAALVYLTQVLLARWMGSFEFGVYVYVWTWVLLLGGVIDLGLASSAQRFIPEYSRQLDLLRGFLSGSRWLVMGLASGLALVAAFGVWLAEPWLKSYEVMPLYLACVALPVFALGRMQDGIARSHDWMNLALMPAYIWRSLLLIGVMAAAYLLGFPTSASTAMMAAIVTTWITVFGQTLVMNRRLARKIEPGPKTYRAKIWLSVSLPIFMVEGFYILLTYADVIVLQQYVSPDQVAVYYAAAKTLALVAFVHFSVAAATAHKFSAFHIAGDRAGLSAFFGDAMRWTFWPSLAATLIILGLGKPFLWLFGPQFVDGYYLMFILAVGPLARATVGPAERLLNMVGEQRACAVVYLTAFLGNIALCVVLIPIFGIAGAAIAISGAMVLEAVLLFFVTRKRLGLHVFIWRPKGRDMARSDNISGLVALRRERLTDAVPRRAVTQAEWQPLSALAAHVDEWRDLVGGALEPNVFYDPAFALAAAPVFGADAGAVLVRRAGKLIALFPARIERRYGVMATLTGWTHPYAPLGVPLVDRAEADAAIAAFLDYAAAERPQLVMLPMLPREGAFAVALARVLARRGGATMEFGGHARALLAPAQDRAGYLEHALPHKKLKELRRQRRRLADIEPVTLATARAPKDVAAALGYFLALEASGWKGRAGTATAERPAIRVFMERAVTALAADGHARVDRLKHGARTFAVAITLRSGDASWFWKIAYDEAYARASPGVQISLDLTEQLLADATITRTDSCATADHPMIDHLWRERLALADLLIAPGRDALAAFHVACKLEALRRAAFATAKRVRDAVRG